MKYFMKNLIVSFLFAFAVAQVFSTINAQETKFRDQSWRIGILGGVNANSVSLGSQTLQGPGLNFNSNPNNIDYSDGKGWAGYGGIFGEYLSDSWWGIQFRVAFDSRYGYIVDNTVHPNAAYDAELNYITFEPLFRIDQNLIPNLNFYGGPIFEISVHGMYFYSPTQANTWQPERVVTDRPWASYGIEWGMAYDLQVANFDKNTSMYLSPFVEGSWLVNQRSGTSSQNSTVDIWSTLTLRAGLKLSLDFKHNEKEKIVEEPLPIPVKIVEAPAAKMASVVTPAAIVSKNIKGYFPILPYVFFDKGNQEIPSRYIMLSKADAQNFNESELGNFVKGDLTVKETNIDQLIKTYYNVMNIYADRMRKNPNEQLTLRGSDPEEKDGEVCANKVKGYLVNIFGIDPQRINIIAEPPRKPSGSALTDPAFKSMLNEENRRVVFVFSNQDMLRPLPYTIRDESSIDNDVIFTISGNAQFKSWNVSITGENKALNSGPYMDNSERIDPAPLMRGLDEGNFSAKVVISMQDGKQVTEYLDFKLLKNRELKNASRYLMIFDYDKSDPVLSYETKIRKEITPGMNVGNTVIIHGHTDIIGNVAGNQKLSQERADQAKKIVDDELGKENKKIDVQSIGIGQTIMQYTFDNGTPEGRMYNRNVFIEIIQ